MSKALLNLTEEDIAALTDSDLLWCSEEVENYESYPATADSEQRLSIIYNLQSEKEARGLSEF